MALPNPLPIVQGSRIVYGPELQQETFLIVPGTSDYVTGGYVITAAQCRLLKIQYADTSGMNATASGFTPVPVFAFVQIGAVATGAGFTGYSQFLFKVLVVTTGVEVGNGANLAGCVWQLQVGGY